MHNNRDGPGNGVVTDNAVAQITRAACTTAGLLAALSGDTSIGALLLSGSAPVADFAERLRDVLTSASARTIFKSANRVNEQIQAEGIDVDPDRMDDTLRHAFRPIVDAQTDDKRRLIESVLLNSARRSKEPAAHVEALRAVSLISEMPPDASLVFAALASLQREHGGERCAEFPLGEVVKRCSLRHFLVYEAVEHLAKNTRLVSVEMDYLEVGNEQPEEVIDTVALTHIGKWLAEWVCANPTSSASAGVPPA